MTTEVNLHDLLLARFATQSPSIFKWLETIEITTQIMICPQCLRELILHVGYIPDTRGMAYYFHKKNEHTDEIQIEYTNRIYMDLQV